MPHPQLCLPAQKAIPSRGPRDDRGESSGLPEGRCLVSPCANLSAADLGQPAICKMRPDGPGEFCLGWGADLLSASTTEKTVVCPGGQAACRGCGHFSRRDLGAYMTCFSPRQHSASLSPLTIHVSYVSLSNDPRDSAAASVCTHTHTPHRLTHTRAHAHRHTHIHTCTHKGTFTRTHTIHTQAHTYIYMYTQGDIHAHTRAHTRGHTHTRAHTCTPIQGHTHTGTHTHTQGHIHAHLHTQGHTGTHTRTQAHPGQTSTSTSIPWIPSLPASSTRWASHTPTPTPALWLCALPGVRKVLEPDTESFLLWPPHRSLLPIRDALSSSLPRGDPESTGRCSLLQGLPALPCRDVLPWGGQRAA